MDVKVKAKLKIDYYRYKVYYSVKYKTNSLFYKELGDVLICKVDSYDSCEYFEKIALNKLKNLSEEDMVRKISEYVTTSFHNAIKAYSTSGEFKKEIDKLKEINITVKIED